jgi:hypothetical protein
VEKKAGPRSDVGGQAPSTLPIAYLAGATYFGHSFCVYVILNDEVTDHVTHSTLKESHWLWGYIV